MVGWFCFVEESSVLEYIYSMFTVCIEKHEQNWYLPFYYKSIVSTFFIQCDIVTCIGNYIIGYP